MKDILGSELKMTVDLIYNPVSHKMFKMKCCYE